MKFCRDFDGSGAGDMIREHTADHHDNRPRWRFGRKPRGQIGDAIGYHDLIRPRRARDRDRGR